MIDTPDKKITASAWRKELAGVEANLERMKMPYSDAVTKLAFVEVIEQNRKEYMRLIQKENAQDERENTKNKLKRKNRGWWQQEI